jgi:hypothetical protein
VLSKADEIGSKLAVGKSVLAVSTFFFIFNDADPDLMAPFCRIRIHVNPRSSKSIFLYIRTKMGPNVLRCFIPDTVLSVKRFSFF